MFLTKETAQDVARVSLTMAEKPLLVPENQVSAVLVRLQPGADPEAAAVEIMRSVPGVTPVVSGNLFQSQRKQLNALRGGIVATLALTLGLSIILIGLVFSMAANERRRELGVLRAMGANRLFVFRTLLAEAGLIAVVGALTGIGLTVLILYLFRTLLVVTLGLPMLLPSAPSLLLQVLAGLGVALVVITLAALLPAIRISRLDPAIAMRE
jgi:putative ABC transport system permease protein